METPYIDIHTHTVEQSKDCLALPSLFLQDIDSDIRFSKPFAAALHPWHADQLDENKIRSLLTRIVNNPNCLALGETGLDKRCSANFLKQVESFLIHLEFAEKYNKPLIIHTVKAWNELFNLLKNRAIKPILHGYRGGVPLTRQLLNLGCYFSFGPSIQAATLSQQEAIHLIPLERIFLETDESSAELSELYQTVATLKNIPPEELRTQIKQNFDLLFPGIIGP